MMPLSDVITKALAEHTPADDERARAGLVARANLDFRAWWDAVAEQMPRWRYARFSDAAWTRNVRPEVLAAARALELRAGKAVVLAGPTGVGKSSALVAAVRAMAADLHGELRQRAALPRLPSVRWITEEQLMRECYRWDSKEDGERWARAEARFGVYIIDEVGCVGSGEAPRGRLPALTSVVNARYDADVATTITTGLPRADFVTRYGLPIWRRLAERARVVDLLGAGAAR